MDLPPVQHRMQPGGDADHPEVSQAITDAVELHHDLGCSPNVGGFRSAVWSGCHSYRYHDNILKMLVARNGKMIGSRWIEYIGQLGCWYKCQNFGKDNDSDDVLVWHCGPHPEDT